MSAYSYTDDGGPAPLDDAQTLSLLAALRIHDARWLIFPRFLPVASPSLGAEWSISVPGGVSWVVVSVTAQLVTSGVAGTRTPSLIIDDGTLIVARLPSTGTQALSLTNRHQWVRGLDDAAQVAGVSDFSGGLPTAPLPPNTRLRTITGALDAGDQWSLIGLYVIQVRERTPQEMVRYMDDLAAGVHDELFPGFPIGL